jgi:hypothetical protein
MSKQPRRKGKFQNKSDQPREVRSIRATDQTWIELGDYSESRGITRADLLEELTNELSIKYSNSREKTKLLTSAELETMISTLEECLNLKGNATSKIKTKLNSLLDILLEEPLDL